MRCFAALVPPLPVIEDLDAFCESRRLALPELRWTDTAAWHVTLAFFPDVAEGDIEEVESRLAEAASRRRPMDLHLEGGGVFPDAAEAKVLWAGVAAGPRTLAELDRLSAGCRNGAAVAGTVVQGGRFTPHVTLARFGRPKDSSGLLEVFDTYSGPPWHAETVHLIESHLGEGPRRRPRYETLAEFPLAAAAD